MYYNNMETVVVNLFGAPGSGKSTGAAYIFSKLKMLGINCELITEFAKDKVWEENPSVFKNQLYILGKQSFKMSRCKDKVDVIITDSPLFLSAFYNSEFSGTFNELVYEVFSSYHNLNWYIRRAKPYSNIGRFQSEEESDKIADQLINLLDDYGIAYGRIDGDIEDYNYVVNYVDDYLKMIREE